MCDNLKTVYSENYNSVFNYETGVFARWGKDYNDDPKFSPFGPEILDIEISTICHGINGKSCAHCYKSNTGNGINMSFETFKKLFDKLPTSTTQVAFGIGDIDSNPDMFKIFEYCREHKVVPNVTINGDRMTDELYDKLAKVLGACSVSLYSPKDICYNAIKELTDRGMRQVNIHCLLSQETYSKCIQVINDYKYDNRLSNLNAIVFLLLKPKGNRNNYRSISFDLYKELINIALEHEVPIGFDSCGAPFFMEAVKEHKDFSRFEIVCESCESSLFSGYINVEGRYFHCSFIEGVKEWKGIDVLNCNDFLADVWNADETLKLRSLLTNQKHELSSSIRLCPIYKNLMEM